jgi:hypothetical protein
LPVAGILALTVFACPPASEPVYAGKRITEWLDGGYEPAALALQEVGTPGLPWLFQKLRREHSRCDYWPLYCKLHRRLPAPVVNLLPRPRLIGFDEVRAANLLMGMGPPAFPAVRAGLEDGNPAVRAACKLAFDATAPRRAIARRPPL